VERVTGIGGVFLRARDPEALAGWYEANLGLELEPWKGSVLRSSGGETLIWSLFEASTDYFGRVDQQAMVNYRVRDLDAMLEQLRRAEIEVEGPYEDENGRFGWGVDPEGNRFELWQPPAGR
jgi:predicted enzyme related to lactoylglutathione lyase